MFNTALTWPDLLFLAQGAAMTLAVTAVSVAFGTVLGIIFGVVRFQLGAKWSIPLTFVLDIFRSVPLLIQLVFWYFAVVLHFPPIATAAKFYGIVISQQGLYLPALVWQGGDSPYAIALGAVFFVALVGAFVEKIRPFRWFCIVALVAVPAVMFLAGIMELDFPVASKFKASGGTGISPEMAALLLAIVFNSASYIAEIVRGSIDALPKGQWEASASLGLDRRSTVNDIILPQVFRVVLPSFGNQYISLTKNTALGIAIGYPDLFNVYGTIANQTGHSLEGIVIVMVSYLILSWIISAVVGWADRRMARQGAMR